MNNSKKIKKILRKQYELVKQERELNYSTLFWKELEKKRYKIFLDKTSLKETIKILMEIKDNIINAAKIKLQPDIYEEINKDDISYCEIIFDKIAYIWGSKTLDVYEKYSNIHSLVDYSSSEIYTLKSLINDFNKIKNKYLN